MMINLKILGNRLYVKIILTEVRSSGGIYYPEQKKTQEAVVLSVGEGVKSDLSPGDRVIYDYFGGLRVDKEDETYLVLKMEDVLAKIS